MSIKDLLEIKTGELLAKTEDLKESNESLRLLNQAIRIKAEETKDSRKSLTESEEKLVTVVDKLAETNERFEITNKEIRKVTEELIEANERIKQFVLKQKDFIDITSHEIRTPTQAILGYGEILISQPQTNVEYIKLIMQNAVRIQKLLPNILDMAKIDNDSLILTKEKFNLDALVSSIIQDFKIQISHSKKNLDIFYDTKLQVEGGRGGEEEEKEKGTFIEADRDRMTQLIVNLLDNAIKFTDAGTIVVTINKSESHKQVEDSNDHHHKEIIVRIKDVGKGIDSQIRSKVFLKSFSTFDSRGTGLGLFICEAIVKAHGGNIWFESNIDGKGVTFSFSLPLTSRQV
jgi:signal transduction histidine kinase